MKRDDDVAHDNIQNIEISPSGPIEICCVETDHDLRLELLKLKRYALDDEEHRQSFLFHYHWIGETALFGAASHVWASLAERRQARCTLIGLMSGTGGGGKKGLTLTLQQFLTEALAVNHPIPARADFNSLDEWHEAAMATFAADEEQVRRLCVRYSEILNGAMPVEKPTGSVIKERGSAVGPLSRTRSFSHRALLIRTADGGPPSVVRSRDAVHRLQLIPHASDEPFKTHSVGFAAVRNRRGLAQLLAYNGRNGLRQPITSILTAQDCSSCLCGCGAT